MPVIEFLSNTWKKLSPEEICYLGERADLRFKNGHLMGWGRRFSIVCLGGEYYAINSAYGFHHLEKLIDWLIQQDVILDDYSNYLNQGMKECNIQF